MIDMWRSKRGRNIGILWMWMKILGKHLRVEKICSMFPLIRLKKSKGKDRYKTIQVTNNRENPIAIKPIHHITTTTAINTNTKFSKLNKDLPPNQSLTWNKSRAEISKANPSQIKISAKNNSISAPKTSTKEITDNIAEIKRKNQKKDNNRTLFIRMIHLSRPHCHKSSIAIICWEKDKLLTMTDINVRHSETQMKCIWNSWNRNTLQSSRHKLTATTKRSGTRTQQTGQCLTCFPTMRISQTVRTITITVTGWNTWWRSQWIKKFPDLQIGFDVMAKTWTTRTLKLPQNTQNKAPTSWATIIMRALIYCLGTKGITWVLQEEIKGEGFFDLILIYFYFFHLF